MTAAEVRLRYSLMDIIKGNIHVDEVTLVSPTVTLIQNADGTSNLDPLLKAQPEKAAVPKPGRAAKPAAGKPLQIDVKKVALTDATIRQVKNYANGTARRGGAIARQRHPGGFEERADGQAGAGCRHQRPADTNATLQAKLTGNFDAGADGGFEARLDQGQHAAGRDQG